MRAKLEKIRIGGYKSFSAEEPQEVTFGDVNVLIGANGAGKSNFVSFFKMLAMMTTETLQEFIGTQSGANSILHYGAKRTPIMEGALDFRSDIDKENSYSFRLTHAGSDILIFTDEKTRYVLPHLPREKIIDLGVGQKESELFGNNVDFESSPALKIIRMMLKQCQVYQFHDTTEKSRIRITSRIDNCYFLYSDGGNLAAYLLMLKTKHPKYYDRIVQWIRDVVPQFHDFVLEPSPYNENTVLLSWREKGNDYIFGPHQISDGSLRFMALATLLLQPPDKFLLPNLLIIDEPELGLHPAAIGALAAMVRTASQHCQVILATQSPRLLDEFSAEEIIVAEWDKRKKCTQIKRLDAEELKEWLDDFALSDLWEKNVLGGQP